MTDYRDTRVVDVDDDLRIYHPPTEHMFGGAASSYAIKRLANWALDHGCTLKLTTLGFWSTEFPEEEEVPT